MAAKIFFLLSSHNAQAIWHTLTFTLLDAKLVSSGSSNKLQDYLLRVQFIPIDLYHSSGHAKVSEAHQVRKKFRSRLWRLKINMTRTILMTNVYQSNKKQYLIYGKTIHFPLFTDKYLSLWSCSGEFSEMHHCFCFRGNSFLFNKKNFVVDF